MDLSVERNLIGRIVIGLYGKVAPKTVENFFGICSNDRGFTPDGIPISYEGTYFTTINERMLIGGDFTHFNGQGGASIYGKAF
jgi:peptidylprolyl isomerase|mmetsp:Transcript_20395/g.3316  ORF Transcript_20395/g.3316 Transcript_20395/m.3316 type:complete len:83 (-) Transcript_20395:254-502(-)